MPGAPSRNGPARPRLLALHLPAAALVAAGVAAVADPPGHEHASGGVTAAAVGDVRPLPPPRAGEDRRDFASLAPRRDGLPERPTRETEEPERAEAGAARTWHGVASWYGPGFHGDTTANGETYDQGARTAAHRTLPFGSQVRVTNLATGSGVVVRINDRGPYVGGREIDLSAAAARDIGVSGTARVRLELLG